MPSTEVRDGAQSPQAGVGPHLVAGTFLSRLTAAELTALRAVGIERSFRRGSMLMFQGEPDDRVMALLRGRVKATRIDRDGRELLLSIRDPGDLLGELAFIDGDPRVASVTALEPVDAIVMPARPFREHLENTPRIAVVLVEILARRFRDATVQRYQLGALDTMGRLSARILELADRYGEPAADGAIAVTSPISREDMAAWTGASRAGVAEAFRALRELGWVQTDRRRLLVRNADGLRSRAA